MAFKMKKNINVQSLVRENVAALRPYTSARDEYKSNEKEMVFLDANENPFENGINRYPDPQQGDLKVELAKIKGVSASQIILGNGSDEVLDLLFRAFCEPKKDNVITLPPTYGMYKVLATINNVQEREVMLDPKFEPRVEKVMGHVDQHTKMIFLCSPNNPTGNSFSKLKVLEILNRFDGLVVIDEAYIDFSEEKSWVEELKDYPNLVVTQTLSKAYGMAGIRLGICYASEEIVKILNKIKPPYNVNTLTQKRAYEGILNVEKVRFEIGQILMQREVLKEKLTSIDFVLKIYPSNANFLLVKVDDASKRYTELLGNGIVTRNRSSQPLCENTLRFTVGTPAENQKLIQVLQKIDHKD